VTLEEKENVAGSDYINANFIKVSQVNVSSLFTHRDRGTRSIHFLLWIDLFCSVTPPHSLQQ